MESRIISNDEKSVCSHGWLHSERVTTSTVPRGLSEPGDRRSVSLKFTLASPEDYFHQGREQLDAGRFSEAIESFFSATQLSWEFVEAHIELGNARSGLKNYDEALLAYKDALEIDPLNAIALYNIALTYADLHQPAEEEAWLQQTIQTDPAYPLAYLQLAKNLVANGKIQSAIECLTSSLCQISTPNANLLVKLGILHESIGEDTNALHYYERAIKADMSHAEAFYRIGLQQIRQGSIHAANLSFANAIKSRPDFLEALELFKKTSRKLKRKKPRKRLENSQESLFPQQSTA